MRPELGQNHEEQEEEEEEQEENHEQEEQEEAPFKGLFINLTSLAHMLNFVFIRALEVW